MKISSTTSGDIRGEAAEKQVCLRARANRKGFEYFRGEAILCLSLGLCGLLFACSAPGIGFWILAWLALVPFFVVSFRSKDPAEAFIRGLFFGTAYNLVYLSWTLNLSQVLWPTLIKPFAALANTIVCALFSAQQGVLFGTLSAIISILPANAGFRWRNGVPAMLLVPLLWVLIFNKLGTACGSISVPWSMIEYSQYKQIELMQSASLIGGPGIAALLVMFNLSLSFLCLKASAKDIACKNLRFGKMPELLANLSVVVLLLLGLCSFGASRIASEGGKSKNLVQVSMLQGNLLFSLNEPDAEKFMRTYLDLAARAPQGICVWPEWSIILQVTKFPTAFNALSQIAARNGQDWIVGCLDCDDKGKNYNAVCTVGKAYTNKRVPVYRKQFLVPFGEYVPNWINKSPLAPLFSTFTPCGQGYTATDSKGILPCGKITISPLLCCELMKPELSSKGVRAGGQVLIDCSNTIWFNSPLLGEQSHAICAMRSAESHRSFIFASSNGPSAIIDPLGRIQKTASRGSIALVSDKVPVETDITPFVSWYR